MFEWLEETAIATTVGQSLVLTGLLSAIHLLGMTLLVGSAIVSGLRLSGALPLEQPIPEVNRATRKTMLLGLLVSVATGFLLFAPRASTAAVNAIFQLKMLLLLSTGIFHFAVFRNLIHGESRPRRFRLGAAVGSLFWFGVALAGSAYILLE